MKFDRLGIFTYSHEENTHAYKFDDDVPPKIKKERADSIMELQSGISYDLNQKKVGKKYRVLIDRAEDNFFIGRSEFDSPEVDNEVLIEKNKKKDFKIINLNIFGNEIFLVYEKCKFSPNERRKLILNTRKML